MIWSSALCSESKTDDVCTTLQPAIPQRQLRSQESHGHRISHQLPATANQQFLLAAEASGKIRQSTCLVLTKIRVGIAARRKLQLSAAHMSHRMSRAAIAAVLPLFPTALLPAASAVDAP